MEESHKPEQHSTDYEHQQAHKLEKQTKGIGTRMSESTKSGIARMKQFWLECKRVLRVTKKPDSEEFKVITKVVSIGMAVIGLIGFLVHFIKELLL